MIDWRNFPEWLLRAWPAIALLPFAIAHFAALALIPNNQTLVNKTAGMIFQCVAALCITYSVNDNLKVFRKTSLAAIIQSWIKEVPRVRVDLSSSTTISFTGRADASSYMKVEVVPITVEERLQALEQSLQSLQTDLTLQVAKIYDHIEAEKLMLGQKHTMLSDHVSQLSENIEKSLVGGFKAQIFGILLAIYGAITSIYG